MSEPRFYVVSLTGWPIGGAGRNTRPTTSYSVLDASQAHREVFTRYAGKNIPGYAGRESLRRAACEHEAARRNALDAGGFPA